jgi:hydroxyquinol 1,2-dioxygenase
MMREDATSQLTEAVVARMERASDARFRQVMTSLIRHLHDVVREVEPSEDEWLAAVRFLTATGRTCDDARQEFILLSDALGVSMLVDAIQHRKPAGATESTVIGPFYRPGASTLPFGAALSGDLKGEPTFVHGRVLALDGAPLAGARLDVWQANGDGVYDVQLPAASEPQLRGVLETDAGGRFLFRTVKPVSYAIPDDGPVGKLLARMGRHPYRPAHIHFRVSARGFDPVTTHLFVAGDPYLDSDAVFGVKRSLIVPFVLHPPGEALGGARMACPYFTCEHEFRLVPEAHAAKRR